MKLSIILLAIRTFSLFTVFILTLGMVPQHKEINLFNFFNKYHKNIWEEGNTTLFYETYTGFPWQVNDLMGDNTNNLLVFFEKLILVVVLLEFALFIFCYFFERNPVFMKRQKISVKFKNRHGNENKAGVFLISSKILALENFFLLIIILFNFLSELNPANSITIVLSIYIIQFFVFSMFIVELNQ